MQRLKKWQIPKFWKMSTSTDLLVYWFPLVSKFLLYRRKNHICRFKNNHLVRIWQTKRIFLPYLFNIFRWHHIDMLCTKSRGKLQIWKSAFRSYAPLSSCLCRNPHWYGNIWISFYIPLTFSEERICTVILVLSYHAKGFIDDRNPSQYALCVFFVKIQRTK